MSWLGLTKKLSMEKIILKLCIYISQKCNLTCKFVSKI